MTRRGREAIARRPGRAICATLCAGLGCRELAAQEATGPAPAPPEWEFAASVYAYFVSDDDDYLQPTFIADRGWLHLEARYNYEDQDTVSTWMGYKFSFGKTVRWDITPMLGGEHVFSTDGEEGSFFYSWSTMKASPVECLQLGLVVQHTKAYETDRDIQRGILVGFSGEHCEVVAHMFNPDDEDPTYVLSATLDW